MKTIRYGIIGAGAISQRRHLPEIASNPRSRVIAIADANIDRANEIAESYNAQPFSDYRNMLRRMKLDAVVVAGPNAPHARMTCDALKAGCHVLCEKPMAATLAEARRMIETEKQTRRRLMIAMNQRFMPQHIRARQILTSRRLGPIVSFHASFAHDGPETWSIDGAQTWFTDPKRAAFGAIGDLGVHKIDLIRWLIGQDFKQVAAQIDSIHRPRIDDHADMILRTSGDIPGVIRASWTHYGRSENITQINCQRGVIRIGADPPEHLVIDHINGDRESYRFAAVNNEGWPANSGVIDAFTDCLIKRRRPPVTSEDGLRSLQVVLAAQRAAATGKTLRVK